MVTKTMRKKQEDFLNHASQYDNLKIWSFLFPKDTNREFCFITTGEDRKESFMICIQKDHKYKIITGKKSSKLLTRRLSVRYFDTPEEALDFLVDNLFESGIKVYKSNAVNFILGIPEGVV